MRKLRKSNQGFTIIEVLIVLAIAGLILLIVFLAVPALQRNSRNTQRRDDIAKLLSLVTEFGSNNNGQVPNNAFCFGEMIINGNAGGGTATQNVSAPGAYYCKASGAIVEWPTGTGAYTNNTTVDNVILRSGAVCNGTTGNASAGSARSVVALFTLEVNTKQCQQT